MTSEEAELQGKVDALDSQAQELADALGRPRKLDEAEQAALLSSTDMVSRAAALGLPKGLIRTTASSESFSDRASKDLFGGDGDMNPATARRLKRQRDAVQAEKRAREILAERRGAATAASAKGKGTASQVSSLTSRFGGGTIQR